ncbi:MAG: hypothetical protein AAF688_11300, partial [Bacteroidota bacterium]
MKKFTRIMIPFMCSIAMALGVNVNAQDGCYAASVVSFDQGQRSNGADVAADRSDEAEGLGMPDMSNAAGGFVSLGFGGSITLQLDGAVFNQPGADLAIFETSFSGDNCGQSDDESAMVEVSELGFIWYEVGTICRDGEIDIEGLPIAFVTQVRITDDNEGSGDGWDLDGVVAINGCDVVPDGLPESCDNFDYFVFDKTDDGVLAIYRAKTVGANSELTLITEREEGTEISLAYNEQENLLYGINPAGTMIETIDPFTGFVLNTVAVDSGYGGGVFSAVYKNGFLYSASGQQNRVVAINVATGAFVEVVDEVPVNGGDLTFIGNDLYLTTKDGNDLYQIAGGEATLISSIPQGVHGTSSTPGGQIAMIARNSSEIQIFNTDGSPAGSLNATLNGETFTFKNGDFTGGCNIPNNDEDPECLNFNVFYSDIPLGSGPTTIYKVNFVGGAADLGFVREFDGNANYHIAYDYDANVIYAVNENGSGFETVDPFLGTSTFTAFPESTQTTTTAAYYQGKLYVGSSQLDEVYVYDLMTGTLTFIANAPVQGGDLVVANEQLFLASQNAGGNWYKISGGSATQLQATPGNGKVNGAAALDDGSIMFSNKDENVFRILDGGSVTDVPVFLDGEQFTLRWGDLATGCNLLNNEEPCTPDVANGSFEEFTGDGTDGALSGGWDYVPEENVPAWSSTDG